MVFDFKKFIDSDRTFVIAEVGSNWKNNNDDKISEIEKYVETAASCDADAVKFQMFTAEKLYAYKPGISDYLKKNGIQMDVGDMFKNLELPVKIIPEINKICKKNKINFMASVFSVDDAKNIDPYVDLHKIASYEINHVKLLEYVAKLKKPILVSTGASTIEEIDFAVNLIKNFNEKIILLQCTAQYPAPLNSLNLNVIKELEKRYSLKIGFSDHSEDPFIGPLVAVGSGARVIEKHFTLNKKNIGPDHKFALEPNQLEAMIKAIRKADESKGNYKKIVLDNEIELKQFASRSIQAIKDIQKGEILELGKNIEILRPGKRKRGLDARFLTKVIGKKSLENVKKGNGIILI